ncbi:glycosyltransferase family 8 protein [Liquorilactobacillus mali]|uniref:glycosyltransferase family 8 protein n=1 Tax=Liquorilactobacillus mali TaxID=1618 RepID=UPI0026514F56|nr:glycosyltransferase family 8 protein [Liquorilactobacillus mali]MDN7145082.1 glycosyltransferase family 8 protein [Liquorilactobacillus mali]
MNVLYTLDRGFEPQLIVSLNTIIKNTINQLNVFIIYDEISNKSRENLRALGNNRICITFLEAPEISKKLIPDRGNKSQYYRLFISDIFKDYLEVKRVIYIDCDTFINSTDIEELNDIDLQNHPIGAVIDPWGSLYKELFNLQKTDMMFNDGFFVIDLEKWRMNKLDEKMNLLIKSREHFVQADQGLLNELVKGDFKILDPRFNVVTTYFEFSYNDLKIYRKPNNFYSENEILSAIKNPVIIHFTSTFLENRPWQENAGHPYQEMWMNELEKKGFNFEKVVRKSFKKENKILQAIYNTLPHFLAIRILGILQAYVRPLILKIKTRK